MQESVLSPCRHPRNPTGVVRHVASHPTLPTKRAGDDQEWSFGASWMGLKPAAFRDDCSSGL